MRQFALEADAVCAVVRGLDQYSASFNMMFRIRLSGALSGNAS